MPLFFFIYTCTLVSSIIVCVCGSEFNDCSYSAELVQEIGDDTNCTFDIDFWNRKINVCTSSSECQCYKTPKDDSSFPQIIPLVIGEGVSVKLTSISNRTIFFYQIPVDKFSSCKVNINETLSVFNTTTKHAEFPTDILTIGSNFFICTDIDSELACDTGCRLNLTVKVNECKNKTLEDSNICNGNGICTTTYSETAFTCKCIDGFRGKMCETLYTNINDSPMCDENVCLNGGTCVTEYGIDVNSPSNGSTTKCSCPPYVTGEYCETILNQCRSSPCVNGVCVEHADGYRCYCVPGFHGKHCELEYNECMSNPCLNKGTCIDRVDKFECRCSKGHTGMTCSERIDPCKPNPCHVKSNCTSVGDGFQCHCPHHYTGKLCAQKIKSCDSNPCRNHGTCIEFEHGHQCMCPVTFAGLHCEYMMDVFAPPMEGPDVSGESHKHNLYIVAGTLGSMVLIVVSVIIACYCKIYETYKQLMWRRLRYYRKRSNSCPDLETSNEPTYIGKHRLSADAIWEATSLCHDNAALDNSNHQTFGNTSLQI